MYCVRKKETTHVCIAYYSLFFLTNPFDVKIKNGNGKLNNNNSFFSLRKKIEAAQPCNFLKFNLMNKFLVKIIHGIINQVNLQVNNLHF